MNSLFCGCRILLNTINTVRGVIGTGPVPELSLVRFASKKASGGGNKNSKQAPGKKSGIRRNDGSYVFPGDMLVYRQKKMWFHPGLNVTLARRRMNLIALKEGIVRVSCEKPDLNFNHGFVKMWYSGREGQTFFKKYFHVIPKPQHTIFKCIDQI